MKKIVSLLFALCLFSFNLVADDNNNIVISEAAQLAMSSNDYKVTAGDVYSLNYAAGTNAISYTITVDTTYKVRISNLAVLDASGKTYLQLKKQVEEIVSKNYPMSGVQFNLITPAQFKVIVKGEVKQTTEVKAWSFTRLSSVVKGVLTSYSSDRDISVLSSDGKTRVYDLFKFSRYGDLSQDPYVRPGDIITINRIKRKVTISGAVERPGTYELMKGENLKELINYYGGGLTEVADTSRMELTRLIDDNTKTGIKSYLDKSFIEDNFELNNKDSIFISDYMTLSPVMFVEGAVGTAGGATALDASSKIPFQFNEGENYAFLVRRIKNLISSSADIKNAYIIRNSEIIPINLEKILYDASFYSEEVVKVNDILRIPFKQLFITVSGAVYKPGRYPYIPDRGWDYYIGLAGGFIPNQNTGDAVKIIDIDGNKLSKDDEILPETTISAKTNSFLYYFNQYAPVITSLLSIFSTTITLYSLINAN